jgi:uncharacterized protein YegP (UPF0339 family)
MGTFEIKGEEGVYYAVLKASNGQVILETHLHTTVAACENNISSIKKNSFYDDKFESRDTKNGNYCFLLKAQNGQMIGYSQEYSSKSGRDNGILSVKKNAPDANIIYH